MFPNPFFPSTKLTIAVILIVTAIVRGQDVNLDSQPTQLNTGKSGNMGNSTILGCNQIFHPKMLDRTNTWRNLTWSNGRVPYVLEDTVVGDAWNAFYSAIAQYNEHTCIRFVPKTDADENYILVQVSKEHHNRCGAASLCYWSKPNQFFEIDILCAATTYVWVHELGHTLCLLHEQIRSDRDMFLTFGQCPHENIAPVMAEQDHIGTLYDYNSAMHYACLEICSAFIGRPTMRGVTKCGSDAQNHGLSILDIDKLNMIYNCGWCHRRRWYSVYRLDNERFATLVDFSSVPADKPRGAIYACRAYVGDEGEVGIGACEPSSKHGWKCIIAWKNKAVIVEPNFELLALPYGSNKLAVKNGGVKDIDYRLVSKSDDTVKTLWIAGGRTAIDKKIYIGVVHHKTGTYIGKVYDDEVGMYQGKALVVVQGEYHEAQDYFVVACS